MGKTKITICEASLRNLKWVLIWPSSEDEINPGKWYYIQVLLFCIATGILFVSVLVHMLIALKENWNLHFTEDIAVAASMLGAYYITLTFIYKRSKIAILLRNLSNFENFGKPPNSEKEKTYLNALSNGIFIYTIIGLTVYAAVKFIKKPQCKKLNKEKNMTENCGLIVPCWTPFSTENSMVYFVVFLYTFICMQLISKPGTIIAGVTYEIARHIILRIKHLNLMVTECFESNNYKICKKKLTRCVIYHTEILDLATKFDDCFSNTMFVHITITSIVFGCLEKQFIEGDKLIASLHFITWLFALLIDCIAGQTLINASKSVNKAIWFSKWYQADKRLKKDIHIFLIGGQKQLPITVGPFGILSYSLFVSVLKMSYSAFCLLTHYRSSI